MELTPLEREVLQALATGMSVEHVAEHLALDVPVVRTHLTAARQKLQAHSTLEAILRALQTGAIERPGSPQVRPRGGDRP
jgi:DNA-binding NarL/FixJ family response regulator